MQKQVHALNLSLLGVFRNKRCWLGSQPVYVSQEARRAAVLRTSGLLRSVRELLWPQRTGKTETALFPLGYLEPWVKGPLESVSAAPCALAASLRVTFCQENWPDGALGCLQLLSAAVCMAEKVGEMTLVKNRKTD